MTEPLVLKVPGADLPSWAEGTTETGMDGAAWAVEHDGPLVEVRGADASVQLRQRITVSPTAITVEEVRIDLLTDSDRTALDVRGARSLARALTIIAAELEAFQMRKGEEAQR